MRKQMNWKKSLRLWCNTTILAGGLAISSTGCANMAGYQNAPFGYGGGWAARGNERSVALWNSGNMAGAVNAASMANKIAYFENATIRDGNYTARDTAYTAAYNAEQYNYMTRANWNTLQQNVRGPADTIRTGAKSAESAVHAAEDFLGAVRNFRVRSH